MARTKKSEEIKEAKEVKVVEKDKTLEIDIQKMIEEKAAELFEEKMKQLEKNEVKSEVEENTPKRLIKRDKIKAIEIKDKKRLIPLVCMAHHRVGYQCKLSSLFITWDGYGDEHEISIEEAQKMNSESSEFLRTWLLADDEEFVEAMGLSELYKLKFETEDIEKFFSQRMMVIKEKLENMPTGLRSELLNSVANKIVTGTLEIPNLISLIKLLREDYNIEIDI